jgi:uncharacterized protein (TIGR00255 family)
MVKSMTGFGRAEHQDKDRKITVEMKSVNHRYLDFNIRMPKKFSIFEAAIRTVLKEYMQRGKVDVFISYEDFTQSRVSLKYNEELARQYMGYFGQMADSLGLENDVTVMKLARCPEVFTMEEQPVDEEELWFSLEKVLREAGESFAGSRDREGRSLKEDLTGKLDQMDADVDRIMERAPQILEEYKEKLKQKTRELLEDAQLEESRIAAEVILFADKICTDEETVRLKSHITAMKQALEDGSGVGRKLDFIAQEMNREANTILSKANDLATSEVAIELKTEIEKIREQIQNIE